MAVAVDIFSILIQAPEKKRDAFYFAGMDQPETQSGAETETIQKRMRAVVKMNEWRAFQEHTPFHAQILRVVSHSIDCNVFDRETFDNPNEPFGLPTHRATAIGSDARTTGVFFRGTRVVVPSTETMAARRMRAIVRESENTARAEGCSFVAYIVPPAHFAGMARAIGRRSLDGALLPAGNETHIVSFDRQGSRIVYLPRKPDGTTPASHERSSVNIDPTWVRDSTEHLLEVRRSARPPKTMGYT
jgi:hypothetical protein